MKEIKYFLGGLGGVGLIICLSIGLNNLMGILNKMSPYTQVLIVDLYTWVKAFEIISR